jgi:hypothetical protein
MTHPRHPRFPEVMLEALAPASDFRESLIGDLAEEFAMRAERVGAAAARWWYYREAIRSVPYLLVATCRYLQARDARELVRVALRSLLFVALIGIPVNVLAHSVAWAFHTSVLDLVRNWSLLIIGPGVASAMVGGYIAARQYARAPLLGAAALCALWSNLTVVTALVARGKLPPAYVMAPIAIVVGTMSGGVLRAWISRSQKPAV